tara:strand:+ start:414 stop:2483 length:2070 start_codon:yes stop_codon:yes gene_type:complete
MALTKVSQQMTNGSVVNVADYGVVGSGDETTLICQAMNDAYTNGDILSFPEGSYTITAVNMPAGTNYAPAMIGQGIVTINLSGAITWQVKNGFSLKDLNFVNTFTYSNTDSVYRYLFTTGPRNTSPRLYNSNIENLTYKQTTITDGSERAYGFLICNGGVTNFKASNVEFEGCREGIVFDSDGHDGDTTSVVINASFTQTYAKNMQRVYVINSIPSTGNFGNIAININNFTFINTLIQKNAYAGGSRTGHSPLIGDFGLNPKLNNLRVQHPIEHSFYITCARGVITNFYGANAEDLLLAGYSETEQSSADIHIADYVVSSASWSSSIAIVTLRHCNGVNVNISRFKGTNLTGGLAGSLIRPFCVAALARSGKNISITATGQYLNGGVIQYETDTSQTAPFENIIVRDCFILDPAPTTNSTTYAGVNEYLYNTQNPTLPWWTSPGGNLIKNLSIINNYFGQTTDTAGTAETTTVLARGRGGSKLAGIAKVRNCSGFFADGNTCDGWLGEASTGFVSHYTFGSYTDKVMINDVTQPSSSIYSVLGNFPATSVGSFYKIKGKNVADYIVGSQAEVLKIQSSAGSDTDAEDATDGSEVKSTTTIVLPAGGIQNNVYLLTNFSGQIQLQTNSGEYAIANANGSTLTSISISANAALTDTASKVCIYTSGNQLIAKNNTASAVTMTVTSNGSHYV